MLENLMRQLMGPEPGPEVPGLDLRKMSDGSSRPVANASSTSNHFALQAVSASRPESKDKSNPTSSNNVGEANPQKSTTGKSGSSATQRTLQPIEPLSDSSGMIPEQPVNPGLQTQRVEEGYTSFGSSEQQQLKETMHDCSLSSYLNVESSSGKAISDEKSISN